MTIIINEQDGKTVIQTFRTPTSKEVEKFQNIVRRRGYILTIRKALAGRASNWNDLAQEADPKDPAGTAKGFNFQDELHKGRAHPIRQKQLSTGEYGRLELGDMAFYFPVIDVDSGLEIEISLNDEIIDNAGRRWLIESVETATDQETGAPIYWKALCKKDMYGLIIQPAWMRELGNDGGDTVVIVEK